MTGANDATDVSTPRRSSRQSCGGAGSRRWWSVSRSLVSLVTAAALLGLGLPRVAGVGWTEILGPLGRLQPAQLMLFVALQLGALWAFTFTITGSLPGISHLRALTVNLAGSLVANTVPFGGVLGIGATYTMCRSWGFSRGAIGISIALGGVFSTAGKVLLPVLGLSALILNSAPISPGLRAAAVTGVGALVAILALFATMMASSRAARAVGGWAERTAQMLLRLIRRPRQLGWQAQVTRLRVQTRAVLHDGWVPMTCGTLGYFALYFILFWVSLRSVGVTVGGAGLVAAFALGRLLTSVAVTPGGIGVVEAGSVVLLITVGADPAAASGVLLFTIFTHVLEIPFGMLAWLAWWWGRRSTPTTASARGQPGTSARRCDPGPLL